MRSSFALYITLFFALVLMTNCKKKEVPPADSNLSTDSTATTNVVYSYIDCQITDFENTDGQVVLGLFNSEAEWDKSQDGLAIREFFIDSLSDPLSFFIDTLPEGIYAIKTFHDENSNNECDLSFWGIPTEKFGYSNNPSIGISGEPSFDDCKFTIGANDTAHIVIDLMGF